MQTRMDMARLAIRNVLAVVDDDGGVGEGGLAFLDLEKYK